MRKRLYHGTSEKAAETILSQGLRPRGENASYWAAASHSGSVYLTDAYAVHFAAAATDRGGGRLALIEIDTSLVDGSCLNADEDALALAWGMGKVDAGFEANAALRRMEVSERAEWFSRRLPDWSLDGAGWEWSMSVIGNCTHLGAVPPEAISRVVLLDREDHWWLRWHDPVVSPQNYRLFGGYYRATTLVFAGRKEEAEGIDLGINPCDLEEVEADVAPRREIAFGKSTEPLPAT